MGKVPALLQYGLCASIAWVAVLLPTHKPNFRRGRKAVHEDAVVNRLAGVGTEAIGSSAAELDALTRQLFALHRDIVKSNRSLLGAR